MSVPASRRKTARTEYVHTAHLLCAVLSRWANRMPKRYDFREFNPLCTHADMVAYHVEAANHIYIRDEETYKQRRWHLTEAENELIHVESKLATIYEIVQEDYGREIKTWCKQVLSGIDVKEPKKPKTYSYESFADLILKERKLIAGVKRSDTSIFKNKVKQDAAGKTDS